MPQQLFKCISGHVINNNITAVWLHCSTELRIEDWTPGVENVLVSRFAGLFVVHMVDTGYKNLTSQATSCSNTVRLQYRLLTTVPHLSLAYRSRHDLKSLIVPFSLRENRDNCFTTGMSPEKFIILLEVVSLGDSVIKEMGYLARCAKYQ